MKEYNPYRMRFFTMPTLFSKSYQFLTPKNFCGIYEDLGSQNYREHPDDLGKSLDAITDLGVGFIRLDVREREFRKDEDKCLEFYDYLIHEISSRKIRPLLRLRCERPLEIRSFDKGEHAYLAYVFGNRYKAVIHHWEIDVLTRFTETENTRDWPILAEELKQIATTVRAVNDTNQIILGGADKSGRALTRHLYSFGIHNTFDALGLEIELYSQEPDPEKILRQEYTECIDLMDANGDAHKPIWLTGVGYPCNDLAGGGDQSQKQAAVVFNVYSRLYQWPRIDKVFWAPLKDLAINDQSAGSPEQLSGLLTRDFYSKQSYDTLKRLMQNRASI